MCLYHFYVIYQQKASGQPQKAHLVGGFESSSDRPMNDLDHIPNSKDNYERINGRGGTIVPWRLFVSYAGVLFLFFVCNMESTLNIFLLLSASILIYTVKKMY